MSKALAQKLRILRARRGVTLIEAAEKTGVTRFTLASLERGKQQPRILTLAKIAEGYEIPVEDLIVEE